jgi:hypothetical protein
MWLRIKNKGEIMTPLHLDILLHYYSIVGDYNQLETNDTRKEYAYDFARIGLLYTPMPKENEQRFRITSHGNELVEKCLKFIGEQST